MKPPRLREGDTVGVISPSWGGGAAYPHRIERGVAYLESLGLRVKITPHAMNSTGYVSDKPENRVSDTHAMFGDPEVRQSSSRSAAATPATCFHCLTGA